MTFENIFKYTKVIQFYDNTFFFIFTQNECTLGDTLNEKNVSDPLVTL